jgi:polyisoprenyl-teichoic acid--peptidoglycan teichoic acid transferase
MGIRGAAAFYTVNARDARTVWRAVVIKAQTRLVAGITALVLVVAAGVFVGFRLLVDRVDSSIPQADLFGSGTPSPSAAGSAAPQPEPTIPEGADIKGPLNILLAGEDTRENEPGSVPHSDAILIMHINADLTKAFLTSLPRDLLVNIPAFGPSGSRADFTKITHAMTYGARLPGGGQDTRQGFALLAQTVCLYTGIDHFDAGGLVSFTGLSKLADVIGGIDINVDYPVTSIHMGPNGDFAYAYGGPFMHYNVGMQHMVGWQVLDYARQRYSLPHGAYDRERHHRQIIKAMITKIFSFDLPNFPFVAPYVVQAVGKMLTLDLRGRKIHEYAYALRNLRPEAVTLVGLPGSSVYSGGAYRGEALAPIQAAYFAALRSDTLDQFLAGNPGLINDPR